MNVDETVRISSICVRFDVTSGTVADQVLVITATALFTLYTVLLLNVGKRPDSKFN